MAAVVKMVAKGMSQSDYENATKLLNLEVESPKGLIFHMAYLTTDGVNVTDLWESEDDYKRFLETRLTPIFRDTLKITSQPILEFYKAIGYHKPESVAGIGASKGEAGRVSVSS